MDVEDVKVLATAIATILVCLGVLFLGIMAVVMPVTIAIRWAVS